MKTRNKIAITLLIIIVSGIVLRLLGLGTPLFFEEVTWGTLVQDHTFSNLGMLYPTLDGTYGIWPHPPISPILYKAATLAFGVQTYVLRSIPLLFGVLSILMVYLICRKYFDMKTTIIAVMLISFSYWHLAASLVIDIDGAILTFLFLIITYAFIEFERTSSRKWLVITGVALGVSLMTKYATFIMLFVLGSYVLLKALLYKKPMMNDVKNLAYITAVGLIVFSIFPIASLLTSSGAFSETTGLFSGYASLFKPTIRPLATVFVFGTPLLIGLATLSALYFRNRMKPLHLLLLLWVIIPIVLYSFFLGPKNAEGPYEKYLMIIIPPMAMLGANFLSKINLSRKQVYLLAALAVVSFLAIFVSNLQPARYIDHNINEYVREAVALRWDFNFPVMANAVPGFYTNFATLAVVSIASVFLLVLIASFMLLKKDYVLLLVVFLAICSAFNVFFVQEFLFHGTHPDISKVTYEMVDYYRQHNISGPIYTNALSFAFYLNKTGSNLYVSVIEEDMDPFDEAKKNSATALIGEYYPTIPKTSSAWKKIQSCSLLKEFDDKNIPVGYIYQC